MLFPRVTDNRLRSRPLSSPTRLPPHMCPNKLCVQVEGYAWTIQPNTPPITSLLWELDIIKLGPDNTANQHSTVNTSGATSSHIERTQPKAGLQITLKETTGKLALARCIYSYHNVILLAGIKHSLTLKKYSRSLC